jgi:hypothetical protein
MTRSSQDPPGETLTPEQPSDTGSAAATGWDGLTTNTIGGY